MRTLSLSLSRLLAHSRSDVTEAFEQHPPSHPPHPPDPPHSPDTQAHTGIDRRSKVGKESLEFEALSYKVAGLNLATRQRSPRNKVLQGVRHRSSHLQDVCRPSQRLQYISARASFMVPTRLVQQ